MYIKQVIIEGFKSYREQVATEDFSPKHNCVVGANGSGKTNFFHAIRFVLSDLFHNLRAEDRQALLHEGAGHQVMSAFVEIVFDNSDNRIPVDKDEVRLRRTIGVKKDEYFLDRKHITKTEVMNLLESAGFSRSNPYYVVQQGKIASLTLMKDSERLDLLKEIGGTRVYEERRKESLKIMQDTETKRKQIMEVVRFIEDRLKELDEEKEELQKYQQLDKQLRSLEYTIFDKELAEAKQKLDQVEEARAKLSEKSGAMHNSIRESHERLKAVEKDLKALSRSLMETEKEKDGAEKQRTEAIKAFKNAELDIKDLQNQIERETKLKQNINQEMQDLHQEIEKLKAELARVRPQHEEEINREHDINRRINECQKELSLMYQKQGRTSQFSSKAERDQHLQKEIANTEAIINKSQQQIAGLEQDVSRMNGSLMDLSSRKGTMQSQLEEREAEIKDCAEKQIALKRDRDGLHGNQKMLRKQEAEIEELLKKARDEISYAEKALESAMPRDARQGVDAVRRLTRDHNILGVHGCLIELINCEDKFNTAVEVTAGNSLYNIVVENDEVSTRLTKYLVQQKAGRITFYPLNRMRAPRVDPPNDRDTVPLLRKLQFDPKFKDVLGQIFGRAVICRNLDVATRVARSGEVDCITMEGDQVERKGAMRGGHYDHKRSKLRWVKIRRENQAKVDELQMQLNGVRAESLVCDQKISGLVGEIEKLEAKQRHAKMVADTLRADMKHLEQQEVTTRRTLEIKERSIRSIAETITDNEDIIQSKAKELGTELTGRLSSEESARLARLNPEHDRLKEELTQCLTRRMEVEARKTALEEALSENHVRRQEELKAQLANIDIDTRLSELESKKHDLQAAKADVQEADRHRKEVMEKIDTEQKRIRELKNTRDELKQAEELYERTIQDEAKDLEQLLNKRILLQQQRDDLMKKIRDLGSLPADAFEKYQDKSLKELHKMMHKCNEQLKKYSHVNKKALDQYVNFMEQREELQRRQGELDKGDEKIKELISVLDMRKDEAIERTFKGVAKNFREAFSELVSQGHGSLVMMKKKRADEMPEDDDEDEDEGDREGQGGGRIEKYSGVKVKVSFTGQGETQSMKQLSGGQKTVVALALIFAIQRCDPAPFYLFDEIDAALDPQYRTAVGNMVRKQADTAQTQFITTTFRPELVKVADRVYGVFHKNRVSHVDVISVEDALRFIDQDQSHQQE